MTRRIPNRGEAALVTAGRPAASGSSDWLPDPVLIASAQPRRPPELWKIRDPRQAGCSPGAVRDCFGRGNPSLPLPGLLVRRLCPAAITGKLPVLWSGSRAHADVPCCSDIGRCRTSAISSVLRLKAPVLADPMHRFSEQRVLNIGCDRNELHRLHAMARPCFRGPRTWLGYRAQRHLPSLTAQ